jgi:hypothetical protein
LIVDLSAPTGESVNAHISDEDSTVTYISLHKVVGQLWRAGRGALMFKLDIARAYRQVPVSEKDRHLLGIKFQGQYFVDLCLPFGGRSCAAIFNTVGDIICFCFQEAAPHTSVLHYLDDFIGIAKAMEGTSAWDDFNRVLAVAEDLGVPLSQKKSRPPSTVVDFLGFTLNSAEMSVSLPATKREKYRVEVLGFLLHPKTTKRRLLGIIGKLMHVSQVLTQGRPFLRRLINRAHSVVQLHFFITLDRGCREDLTWWAVVLDSWIGTKLITFGRWRRSPHLFARSDASGSQGFGLICGSHWCSGSWSPEAKLLSIAVLEMVPIVVAAELWGHKWRRKRILFETDNEAVVHCARSWLPKDDHLARLFRRLATLGIRYSFDLKVIHIPGRLNTDADALSRGRIRSFLMRNPRANPLPDTIQPGLIEELTEVPV